MTMNRYVSMNRAIQYDLIRIFACLLIVMMHAPLTGSEADGLLLSALSYLTAPGIGLFFMVSGALLLPVKTGTGAFLRRRFTKIVIPAIVWTLFYIVCNMIWTSKIPTWKMLLSIPLSTQGNPVFWFIYTLVGLYLLSPILSRWIRNANRREIEFYLCLWGITLCYPLLDLILDINTSNTGILYYFAGYAGYFLLGYYLRAYPERIPFSWSIAAMIIALIVPATFKLGNIRLDFYSIFWYLSVFVAVQCLFWWQLFCSKSHNRIVITNHSCLAIVSQLTFGVYLVHIFIMRYLLWKWDIVLAVHPYWLQTSAIILLTFAGSLIVSYLISLLPFARYLIGYQRKSDNQ